MSYPLVTTYPGSSFVAWSPDGKLIATGGLEYTVQLYEALTGMPQATLRGPDTSITRVAWSPDGRLLAACAWDCDELYVWEAMTGTIAQIYGAYGQIEHSDRCLAWSPDGYYLAAASYHSAHVWQVSDQTCVAHYPGFHSAPEAAAWSPDGRHLAMTAVDGRIYVRDFASGRMVWRSKGHISLISALAYSPNGEFLASSSWDATVQVRESLTGDLVTLYRGHPLGVPGIWHWPPKNPKWTIYSYTTMIWDLAWSPDSRYIASASSGPYPPKNAPPYSEQDTVHIWDAETGRRLYTYAGHKDQVRGVAWSPDGRYLASCGEAVHIWQAPI